MFENIKKLFKNEKKKVTLQKFKPFFITIDGVEHEGLEYSWYISERLISVTEYIMVDIKRDQYIKDKNEFMYMLSNVISIRWELLEEKIVEDNFSEYIAKVTTEELEGYANE